MINVYLQKQFDRLKYAVEHVYQLIERGNLLGAFQYLDIHVIGEAEELMDELEELMDREYEDEQN